MNPLKWIIGGSKMADKSLDAIIKGGDALILTEEERIKYRLKASELWLDIQRELKDESSVRSVTRRIMAVMIMGPYVGMISIGVALMPFKPEYADFIMGVAEGKFGMLALGVGAFYFGAHLLRAKK